MVLGVPILKHFRVGKKKGLQVLFRDNFPYFFIETYVVTPHWNHLSDTVLKRGHNMFLLRNKKNYL